MLPTHWSTIPQGQAERPPHQGQSAEGDDRARCGDARGVRRAGAWNERVQRFHPGGNGLERCRTLPCFPSGLGTGEGTVSTVP